MKLAALPKPHFDTDGMFTLTVKRPVISSEKGSEKTSEKILKLIKGKAKITIEELAEKINISKRSVEKHLRNLKKLNKLERIGSDKAGYWKTK